MHSSTTEPTIKKHEEVEIPTEPFNNWRRQRFTGERPEDALLGAEQETDRDLDKPIEQLCCDIHETYQQWIRLSKSPDIPEDMRKPVGFILYALVRTASMQARVALANMDTQKKMVRLTWGLWFFTAVLVATGIIALIPILGSF